MKARLSWLRALGVAAFLCVVPLANADQVQMELTGLGNSTVVNTKIGGVYVGPYESNFGLVVCADFYTHSYLNQEWTANVSHSDGDISLTRQASILQDEEDARELYDDAAYLVEKLLAAYANNLIAEQIQYSFALWGLFDNRVFTQVMYDGTHKDKAMQYAAEARAYLGPVKTLAIYTPTGVAAGNVTAPPQEFLTIRTPEGSVTILWGIHMLAVAGMIVLFRRRAVRAAI